MQMFVLDPNPVLSAQYLCDAHVRVICRETTMLLSSWYHYNIPETWMFLPYRPMNENQPLAKQMSSVPVRRWAVKFAGAVFKEFRYRFNKEHASEAKYRHLIDTILNFDPCYEVGTNPVRFTFVAKGDGVFPGQTMSQAVRLYRLYYIHKVETMKVPVVWTGRSMPEWLVKAKF